MKSMLKTALAVLVAGGCLLGSTACGETSPSKPKKSKKKAVKTEKVNPPKAGFRVVRIDGEPRVVTESELESIRFELRSAYREQLSRYNKQKQEALKNKAAFDKPKPERPRIRVAKKTFETEAEANAYRDRLLTKKKAAKSKPTPAKKPPESSGS
jgi:hypothetical protein